MGIKAKLRGFWHSVSDGQPGRRFEDRYEREAHKRDRQHFLWRLAKIIGGIAAIAIGIVEIVFPGPAFVFLIVGGALLATQSRTAAKVMDWLEVRIRRMWRAASRLWHRASARSS